MTQKHLLVAATGLTLVLGVAFFVIASSPSKADAATKKKKPSPSPTVILSPTPTPVTTVTPTTSPTASISPTPSPSMTLAPSGSPVRIWQLIWKKQQDGTTPISITGGPAKAIATTSTTTNLLSGGSSSDDSSAQDCLRKANKADNNMYLTSYLGAANMTQTGTHAPEEAISAKDKATDSSYLISNVLTASNADSAQWKSLKVFYTDHRKPGAGGVKIYYRVNDTAGTSDAGDTNWLLAGDGTGSKNSCIPDKDGRLASFDLSGVQGKFFQYKIQLVAGQDVKTVWFDMQPLKNQLATTAPTNTPGPVTTPTNTAEGRITVYSVIQVPDPEATPSPKTALLPQTTPSPTPKTTAPNPACFTKENTDPAANIPLSFRQTDGTGSVKVEDQQTDADGLWQGIDGNVDSFPVGTYQMKFGDYQKADYKLVDICVTPNDGNHLLKTQTSASGNRATIIVKAGQETKVTLLYAPRNKAYVTMSKFAIDKNNKVLKVVYPGVSFRYLIRYENTGESDAKNLSIADVIPEQYQVIGSDTQELDDTSGVKMDIDANGRTTVTKKIGDLTKGQKGSFVIPVTLKADAFGSTSDIASQITANQRQSQSAGQTASTPAASTNTNSTSTGSDNFQVK